MARWYGGHRNHGRRWVYVILVLLIAAVVVAYIYRGHSLGKEEAVAPSASTVETTESKTSVSGVKPETGADLAKFVKPAAEDNPAAAELITEATSYIGAKPAKIIDARDKLNEALSMPMSERQRAYVKEQLSSLADKWLFSRTIYPQDKLTGSYTVKPGELLSTIGKQFKVPYEILMEINRINRPEALQAEEMIKVINGPFHARVYRSTFTMDLYLQTTFIRSFRVGLGKPDRQTPTGLWRVKPGGKLPSPLWTDPDTSEVIHPESPDYPLGSRWIELEGVEEGTEGRTGIGIHGTKESETIGSADSRGCIRLDNGNVILLYNLLVPVHSLVRIEE